MMYVFTWKDLDEVVNKEVVNYFTAVRLLKAEGLTESDAALWLCRMLSPLVMQCDDGYVLTIKKV